MQTYPSAQDSAPEKDNGLMSGIKRLLGKKAAKMTDDEVADLHAHAAEAMPLLMEKHRRLSTVRNIGLVAVALGIYVIPALGAVAGAIYGLSVGGTLLGGALTGGFIASMATAPAWLPGVIADTWTAYKGAEVEAKIDFLAAKDYKYEKLEPATSLRDFDLKQEARLRTGILRDKFAKVAKTGTVSAELSAHSKPKPTLPKFGLG